METTALLRIENEQLKAQIRHLEALLPLDKLTGLYSSQSEITRDDVIPRILSEAMRHNHKLAFLHFDLDSFKSVNDKHGHAEGDKVIESMARSLKEVSRAEDLAMRMAIGDEFGLLLVSEADSVVAAKVLISRLKKSFAKETIKLGHPDVGFSTGVVRVDPAETPEAIFKRSDEELYRAKTRRGSVAVEGRELMEIKREE